MPFVTPPRHRQDGRLDWASQSVPHRDEVVSGDAIFVEEGRPDGRLMFLLIDVMGHGPRAAAVVEMFRRFYLWDEATSEKSPGELLDALSSLIAPYFETMENPHGIATERELVAVRQRFAAAMAALIDPATGEVFLSLAHFPTPHRIAPEGVQPLGETGPWLGDSYLRDAFGPDPFPETYTRIGPGDGVIATTDGFTDARCPGDGRPDFRTARLEMSLRALTSILSAGARVTRLMGEVSDYGGADWPDDDTTVIAWSYTQPSTPSGETSPASHDDGPKIRLLENFSEKAESRPPDEDGDIA